MAFSTTFKSNNLLKKEYLFSNKALFYLFLPLVTEQFLEFLVGLVNSIMVASLGEVAVSAVSLVEFIMFLLISVFAALAAGGTVIAGQYFGKGDYVKAREAANQMLWFVSAVGLLFMFLVYLGESFILNTVFGEITPSVRSLAATYLQVSALSIPFLALYAGSVAIFRTMGNTKLPLQISLLMGLMTVAGNLLALYVWDLGTLGVAFSTLLARASAGLILLLFATNPQLPLCLTKSLPRKFDVAIIKSILGIGVPYGLENGLFHLGRIFILSLIASFGTAAIAANAVAGTIALFGALPGLAIGLGLTVVIAKCVGAGDYGQARYYTKKILAVIYLAHIFINLLILAVLPFILKIYALSAEATQLTQEIVLWHAVFAVTLWPLAYTLPVTFRAAGDARYPMYVGILTMFFCRLALAYFLGRYLEMGLLGTWLAIFIDWFVKALLFGWRYFNEKWTFYKAV